MADDQTLDWFDQQRTQQLMAEQELEKRHQQRLHGDRSTNWGNMDGLANLDVANAPSLAAYVQSWYDALPRHVQPKVLRCRFPHIIGKLAKAWDEPRQTKALLDDMMIDERGDRQGFPLPVLQELYRVRDYYFDELHPDFKQRLEARRNPYGDDRS